MLSQSRTQRGSHFGGLQLISSAELISLQWGGLLQVSFLFFAMSFSLHFSRGSYYATSLSFGSLHLNFYQSSKLFQFSWLFLPFRTVFHSCILIYFMEQPLWCIPLAFTIFFSLPSVFISKFSVAFFFPSLKLLFLCIGISSQNVRHVIP